MFNVDEIDEEDLLLASLEEEISIEGNKNTDSKFVSSHIAEKRKFSFKTTGARVVSSSDAANGVPTTKNHRGHLRLQTGSVEVNRGTAVTSVGNAPLDVRESHGHVLKQAYFDQIRQSAISKHSSSYGFNVNASCPTSAKSFQLEASACNGPRGIYKRHDLGPKQSNGLVKPGAIKGQTSASVCSVGTVCPSVKPVNGPQSSECSDKSDTSSFNGKKCTVNCSTNNLFSLDADDDDLDLDLSLFWEPMETGFKTVPVKPGEKQNSLNEPACSLQSVAVGVSRSATSGAAVTCVNQTSDRLWTPTSNSILRQSSCRSQGIMLTGQNTCVTGNEEGKLPRQCMSVRRPVGSSAALRSQQRNTPYIGVGSTPQQANIVSCTSGTVRGQASLSVVRQSSMGGGATNMVPDTGIGTLPRSNIVPGSPSFIGGQGVNMTSPQTRITPGRAHLVGGQVVPTTGQAKATPTCSTPAQKIRSALDRLGTPSSVSSVPQCQQSPWDSVAKTPVTGTSVGSGRNGRIKRKFPGPAGALPKLETGENMEDIKVTRVHSPVVMETSSQEVPATQSSLSQVPPFESRPWMAMLADLDKDCNQVKTVMAKYNIVNLLQLATKKKLSTGKVPVLCVLLDSILVHSAEASAVFKDPTGVISGTLHRDLAQDYQLQLQPGAVLVLKQVGVFSPSGRTHYLNVTPNNLAQIYASSHNSVDCTVVSAEKLTLGNVKDLEPTHSPKLVVPSLMNSPSVSSVQFHHTVNTTCDPNRALSDCKVNRTNTIKQQKENRVHTTLLSKMSPAISEHRNRALQNKYKTINSQYENTGHRGARTPCVKNVTNIGEPREATVATILEDEHWSDDGLDDLMTSIGE